MHACGRERLHSEIAPLLINLQTASHLQILIEQVEVIIIFAKVSSCHCVNSSLNSEPYAGVEYS